MLRGEGSRARTELNSLGRARAPHEALRPTADEAPLNSPQSLSASSQRLDKALPDETDILLRRMRELEEEKLNFPTVPLTDRSISPSRRPHLIDVDAYQVLGSRESPSPYKFQDDSQDDTSILLGAEPLKFVFPSQQESYGELLAAGRPLRYCSHTEQNENDKI